MEAPARGAASETGGGSPASRQGVAGRRLVGLLRGTRPRQWTKNLLVLVALLFSGRYQDPGSVVAALEGLLLFVLASGSLYLLNDVADAKRDRAHPEKRRRPIAAGVVSIPLAVGVGTGGLVVAAALGLLQAWPFGVALCTYVVLQIAYSWLLKHLVIIDLIAIAGGFVLRAAAGALVINVDISPWLYLCTFLAALFLGVNKRWAECEALDDPGEHRPVLQEYSREFLDAVTAATTASALMAYSLYTFSAENLPPSHAMMLTIPIVLYGTFRYLYLVRVRQRGQSPERLLYQDPGILGSGVAWVLASALILQFGS